MKYFEIDFPSVCRSKAHVIRKNALFTDLLINPIYSRAHNAVNVFILNLLFSSLEAGGISSVDYNLFGADLRDLDSLTAKLGGNGFDASLPTLFLSECVLCYINPSVRTHNFYIWNYVSVTIFGNRC